MEKQIIKKCFSLLLALTLVLCSYTVLPDEDYNNISPASIFDDEEPRT